MINFSVPETIDERVLNIKPAMNKFQMTENNNLLVNSAKAIGCSVVNVGAQDIIGGREHLILGLIWQIVRVRYMFLLCATWVDGVEGNGAEVEFG